ncbi:MAG: glycosyltransferase family 2 protein [bacterium]
MENLENTQKVVDLEVQKNPYISVILPCLNEEKAVGFCIESINKTAKQNNLDLEIIVVDNGSTDSSTEIVEKFKLNQNNLILISEPVKGYGSAYMRGLREARGKYFFMADADATYDFGDIPRFIEKLAEGNDVVIGNRFSGMMESKSMTFSHRWIGNPILSSLVKLFFKVKIHDIHCGARAISRDAYSKIVLYTLGMEFASEMIIKSAKAKLQIVEIPISYKMRIGDSKLETFKDGWRHLRFILLYSPVVIFLIPGLILFLYGLVSMFVLYIGNFSLFGVQLYFHPMFLSSLCMILGYELIFFTGFSRVYAITHLGEKDKFLEKISRFATLEKALVFGSILALASILIFLSIFIGWIKSDLGNLNQTKNLILALTFAIIGVQTITGSFMLSILGIKEK